MPVKTVLSGSTVPVRIWTDDIDEGSKAQLANLASLPFIHHHVAAMPDVHLGIGATIGSVIATHQAIIAAAVGVDLGCGMVAARLSLTANDLDDKNLKQVFDQISRDVPVGRAQHPDDRVRVDAVRPFEPGLKALTDRHPQLLKAFGKFSKWMNQMGTLGGGNHFIEVCLDEADRVLSAVTLLAADDLDRRLGSHPVGEFVVDVQRPRRFLYRIAVAEGDAPARMLLVTVVARSEEAR